MALFTVPLALSDGTDTRTFGFLRQVPNQISGLYDETAASAMAQSRLMSAHTTEKSNRERHLLQSSEVIDLVDPGDGDPTSAAVVVNITVSHHKKHNVTDIEKRLKIALAAAGISGFTAKFIRGEI